MVAIRLVGVVRLSCYIAVVAAVPTFGESLTDICDRLERLAAVHSDQLGIKKCREIGGSNSTIVAGEDSFLVQERYLHLRANFCQSLADKQKSAENRKVVSSEALAYWEDYFQWLKNLPAEKRKALIESKGTASGRKIWAAAAAIGATAVSAEQPEQAWFDYEDLVEDNAWLGADALNWWLAVLVYPDIPKRINDNIFPIVMDAQKKLRELVEDEKRMPHWRKFGDRLREMVSSGRLGRTHQIFLERLDRVLPPNAASADVRFRQ